MSALKDPQAMRDLQIPLPTFDARLNNYFQFYLWGLFGVFISFAIVFVAPAIHRCTPFGHLISRRKRNLPWVFRQIANARKHVLYGMLDVNDYNGQSRLFTVLSLVVAALLQFEYFNQSWAYVMVTPDSSYYALMSPPAAPAGNMPVTSATLVTTPSVADNYTFYTYGDYEYYSDPILDFDLGLGGNSNTNGTRAEPGQRKRRFVYPLQTLFARQLLLEQRASKFPTRVVPWLYTICVAILIGWLTWQSLVANFSRPNSQYYRNQCVTSWLAMTFFTINLINTCVFYFKYNADQDSMATTSAHYALLGLALAFQLTCICLQIKITMFPDKASAWRVEAPPAAAAPAQKEDPDAKPTMKEKMRLWWHHNLAEHGPFKFPAWFLAAVLTSVLLLAFNTVRAVDWVDNAGDCAKDVKRCMQLFYYQGFDAPNPDDLLDRIRSYDQVLEDAGVNVTALVEDYIAQQKQDASLIAKFDKVTENLKKAKQSIDASISTVEEVVKNLRIARFVGVGVGCLVSAFTIFMNVIKFREIGIQYYQSRGMGRMFKDRSLERQKEEWNTVDETMQAVHNAPLHRAVYMFAALTSISVWQMYIVTSVVSIFLAVLTTRWFWYHVFPIIAPALLATTVIIITSTLVINRYFGQYVYTDGKTVTRAGAFLAYATIFSIAFLALSFFLAVTRIVLLVVTTILGVGRLDRSIFAYFQRMDAPHNAFLGTIRFTYETRDMSFSRFKPGQKGRACRNWYNLQRHVHANTPRELETLVNPPKAEESSLLIQIQDVFGTKKDNDKEGSKQRLFMF